MLKTYRLGHVAHLTNVSYQASTSRYRAYSFQPGDIVTDKVFDFEMNEHVNTGLVVWCVDSNSQDDIGVLWSGTLVRC